MLDEITPVVLTFNEAPNIGRTLSQLSWARDIVVVDSFSTDETREIVAGFPQARLIQRAFASHADQWNFAAFETGIATPWILALDADYIVTDAALDELRALAPSPATAGYRASFRYCVWGKPLRGALYPPVTVLFRRAVGRFIQDGHTHRLTLTGDVGALSAPFLHDDRKSVSHWLAAQDRYMRLEAEKIAGAPWATLNVADKIRRAPPLAVFAVFFHCYLVRGGILDGRAGLFYALQRALTEALLSLRLIERWRA